MKKQLTMRIVITQDEDGVFVASCPALPGCHSQGDTYEEAVRNVEEAIRLCLKVAEKDTEYRSRIDVSDSLSSRFVGISDVSVPQPTFV